MDFLDFQQNKNVKNYSTKNNIPKERTRNAQGKT